MAKKRDLKLELLAQVPLFAQCGQPELRRIGALADEIQIPAGKALTVEGKPGRECFVVAEGEAVATLRGKELARFGPGDFFGEMALLDREPRSATITAETPMTLFVVDARSFWALIDDAPSVAKKMLRGIGMRLRVIENAPSH